MTDTVAYIAEGWNGLRCLNISDPVNPLALGWLDPGGLANNVLLSGDYVYLAQTIETSLRDLVRHAWPAGAICGHWGAVSHLHSRALHECAVDENPLAALRRHDYKPDCVASHSQADYQLESQIGSGRKSRGTR